MEGQVVRVEGGGAGSEGGGVEGQEVRVEEWRGR